MKDTKNLTINIKGCLMDLDIPKVMGILNVTPDSFYAHSRSPKESEIIIRVTQMRAEGVDIIDVGGCSTRPGYEAPSAEEEWQRVDLGCRIIREISPDIPLSIDTFRASVAKKAVIRWKADIINDVSGGKDPEMWKTVADLRVPYILTHNPDGCDATSETSDITASVITDFAKKINQIHRMGVNDVIIDPGFGFAKSLEDNFRLLDELDQIAKIGLPLLVGVSRKSMIYKTLGCTPEDSLAGTVALNAIALEKGADILRVHDVKAAVETVKIFAKLKGLGI